MGRSFGDLRSTSGGSAYCGQPWLAGVRQFTSRTRYVGAPFQPVRCHTVEIMKLSHLGECLCLPYLTIPIPRFPALCRTDTTYAWCTDYCGYTTEVEMHM